MVMSHSGSTIFLRFFRAMPIFHFHQLPNNFLHPVGGVKVATRHLRQVLNGFLNMFRYAGSPLPATEYIILTDAPKD